MNRRLWFLVAAVALGLIMASNARWHAPRGAAVEPSPADTPTPALPAQPVTPVTPGEAAPPAPGADYVWVDGHWAWHDHERKFEWEPGYWRRQAPVFIAHGIDRQAPASPALLRVEHLAHAPEQRFLGEGLLQERHLGL